MRAGEATLRDPAVGGSSQELCPASSGDKPILCISCSGAGLRSPPNQRKPCGSIYRQQGATVECSIVLTGGWQTSKETAYVEATRARHGTDWHIVRDQLGNDEQDAHRIKQLTESMSHSRRQTPSLAYGEAAHRGW